jgi:hypothetical protein
MIEIFFSYAHADEALMDEVRRQLIIHERNAALSNGMTARFLRATSGERTLTTDSIAHR